MQGKKDYQEKLFLNFQLSDRVPKENFYRRLKDILDLSFVRKQTMEYYGKEGPVLPDIFFNCKNVVHWSLVPKAFGTSSCIIRIRQRSDKFFNPETISTANI